MQQPSQVQIVVSNPEPNLLIRVIWFVFVGWWLSQLVILVGWLFNLTVLGLPLGIYILNRVPQAATLKSSRRLAASTTLADGTQVVGFADQPQHPWWIRAVYFLLVGWWASLLWLEVAWLLGVLIIGLPLSFWMFGAAGKVTTLRR